MFWKPELDIVSSKSDNSDIVELNAFQMFASLIDIHLSEFSFCRNLEVFESHLGNLPFDIHHALKVSLSCRIFSELLFFNTVCVNDCAKYFVPTL